MSRVLALALIAGVPIVASVGCSTAPETRSERVDLRADAEQTLANAVNTDASLKPLLDRSVGYVVFPHAGKGGFVIGAAYGKGVLYENGVATGYADMSQGSVGAQIGGQEFSQIIVFETPDALNRFKSGSFAFDATASAVALEEGAAAKTTFKDNVATFIYAERGLMADASIGGQQFRFKPIADVGAQPAGGEMKPSPTYEEKHDTGRREPLTDEPGYRSNP